MEEELTARFSERLERQLNVVEGLVRDKAHLQDKLEEYMSKCTQLEKSMTEQKHQLTAQFKKDKETFLA